MSVEDEDVRCAAFLSSIYIEDRGPGIGGMAVGSIRYPIHHTAPDTLGMGRTEATLLTPITQLVISTSCSPSPPRKGRCTRG